MEYAQVKAELSSKFNITELGLLTHILGVEVAQRRDGSLRLAQTSYALRVLESVHMQNCNAVSPPLDPNVKLVQLEDGDPRTGDPRLRREYLSGIGKLMYLAVATRVDLSFAVQYLSQFSQRPAIEHLTALKCVFRYVGVP